jgi:hypothetical protein
MSNSETILEAFSDADPSSAASKPRKRKRPRIDASSLGLGVLLALAGAGLYYMHWRTKDAVALLNGADAQTATLNTMLAGGQKSLDTLSKSLQETREVVARFAQRDNARLASGKPLDRDPFEFDSLEPRQTTARAGGPSVGAREEAKDRALKAARALTLQSIMYGSSRRSCLIDGKLYFENAKVGEFSVVRIAADSVIVRSGEFSFELRLRK